MNGPVPTVGLGTSTKLIGLTKRSKHRHVPSPISLSAFRRTTGPTDAVLPRREFHPLEHAALPGRNDPFF